MKTQLEAQRKLFWKNLVCAGTALISISGVSGATPSIFKNPLGNTVPDTSTVKTPTIKLPGINLPIPSIPSQPVVVNTVNSKRIHLKVEFQSLTYQVQQEIGSDEPFVIYAFTPTVRIPSWIYTRPNTTGAVDPVSVSKGKTETFRQNTILFNGDVDNGNGISGGMRLFEEDEEHSWSSVQEYSKRMREAIKNDHNQSKYTSNDLIGIASTEWTMINYLNPLGQIDMDDQIATRIFDIPAVGNAVENVEWLAQGDGGSYLVRYKITRTPLPDSPFSPAPDPFLNPPPVVVPNPAPTPGNTGTTPPAPSPTPTISTQEIPPYVSSSAASGYGDFQPLGPWDIKLEAMSIDRTGGRADATFSIRNPQPKAQTLSTTGWELAVIDADGIGVKGSDELYDATTENRILAPMLAPLAPNATIKVRLVTSLNAGTPALRKLTLQYWGKDRLEFDISNLAWARASQEVVPGDLKQAQNEFNALGAKWDVRFDGWRVGRGHGYEVFATFRNVTTQNGWFDIQTCDVSAQDANGLEQASDPTLYRIEGTSFLPTPHLIIVPPGGEAKVRYNVSPLQDAAPSKIVFTEGRYKKDTVEIGMTP